MCKEFTIQLTKEILNEEVKEEIEIFSLLKNEIYQNIENDTVDYDLGHQFGLDEKLMAAIIMAIISIGAKNIIKEGIELSKIALLDWITRNKKKIERKLKSEKQKIALDILIKYLSK